jgi:hypothetical protein
MEIALPIIIGVLLIAVIYLNRAARKKNRQRDRLYQEVSAENTARLHARVSDLLASSKADVDNAIRTIVRQRDSGAGWEAALKAAFPRATEMQVIRLRADILAVAQSAKSENEAIDIVIRRFAKPAS